MKFTIVIPTLNRAEVLLWSVNSVLNQKGQHDFDIIVSDNMSDDNTGEVVKKIGDDRIKYICPSSRLSMSSHWEFAAGFVDKTDRDRLVMFLGDDDILSKNAFNIAEKIFKHYSVDALRRTSGYYYTPDCPSSFAGFLILPPINGEIEIRNSIDYLEEVALFNISYGELPLLYHGFIRVDILNKLSNFGLLFAKAAPDIFSDVNIAALNIKYASINYPLTLGVASPKSNGLNFAKGTPIGIEYKNSSLRELNHNYSIDCVTLHVLDCLEHVIKKHSLEVKIDYEKCYEEIIKTENVNVIIKIWSDLKKITNKNSFMIALDLLMMAPKYSLRYIPESWKRYIRGKGSDKAKKESFSYFGDLRLEGISDPKGCIEFIESKVKLKYQSEKIDLN